MKETLQSSYDLINAAKTLFWLNFRRRWRLGDQFCVLEECELLYQSYYTDRVYLIDNETLSLMEEFSRQGVPLERELGHMVFIPKVEDIVDFCVISSLKLELTLDFEEDGPLYKAELSATRMKKNIKAESHISMRLAAILVLGVALQSFIGHPDPPPTII